jgi:cold shock CspA family protein
MRNYKDGDIVSGVLINAPRVVRGFAFVKPDDGGENIYVPPNVFAGSGLSARDIGSRVTLMIHSDPRDPRPPCASSLTRDDSLIEGEEPDPIEREILRRLSELQAAVARLAMSGRRDEITRLGGVD